MRWTVPFAAACAGAEPDALRKAWLVETIHTDNLVWRSRDEALLASKYRAMAEDPYDWMRGSAVVFLRDLDRAGTGRLETRFLTLPATTRVAIVGDPHPENVGIFAIGLDDPAPDEEPVLVLEAADLDGAGFGPYLVDVRRALLGLGLLLDGAGCDRDCRGPILEAQVEGYVDEIDEREEDESTWTPLLSAGSAGLVLDRAVADVIEQGRLRLALRENTEPVAGGARFRTVAALDREGEGLLHLADEERAQVDRLVAELDRPPGFRVLDVVRRYGVGVASRPAIRYAVLWDRGEDGDADDALVQLREVVDPPVLPGTSAPATWDSQADRIVGTTLAAWSRPDVDPWIQAVTDGVVTFKVLAWSSWDQPLDHRRIGRDFREGLVGREDLEDLAEELGRQLAAVHARARTADGRAALPEISADLDDREERFVEEQLAAADQDLARTLRDHALFAEAFAAGELGP